MQDGDFKTAFQELLDAERTNQVKSRVTQEGMMLLYGKWAAGNEPFPKETDIKTRAEGVTWGKTSLKERNSLFGAR